MPKDKRNKSAEHQKAPAHTRQMGADQHAKGDRPATSEHSQQTHDHSFQAPQASEENSKK